MRARPFVTLSTLIFIVVAIAHALRLYRHWPLQLGPYSVPVSVSWIGLVIAGLLAIWGISLLRR